MEIAYVVKYSRDMETKAVILFLGPLNFLGSPLFN